MTDRKVRYDVLCDKTHPTTFLHTPPERGELFLCVRCDDYVKVDQGPPRYRVSCRTCSKKNTKSDGMTRKPHHTDIEKARKNAHAHVIAKGSHHVVDIFDGLVLVETVKDNTPPEPKITAAERRKIARANQRMLREMLDKRTQPE